MNKAESGDTVQIQYTGTLSDGSEFDSSEGGDPLTFTLGTSAVLPAFEAEITGMDEGEDKTFTIAATDAYGEPNPEMISEMPIADLPGDLHLAVGEKLQAEGPDGQFFVVEITAVTDDTVTLDANHPLAGEDLTFDIKLEEIVTPAD